MGKTKSQNSRVKKNQIEIDLDNIAKLANLQLTEEEKKKFNDHLPKILEYVGKLSAVETRNVKPLAHASGLRNVWREDETISSLMPEEALANAKEVHNDFFKVKAIFDAES